MNPTVLIAAISATVAFGTAWQIGSWRIDSMEKKYVEQALFIKSQATTTAIRRLDNALIAQDKATARISTLRVESAAASDSLVRLYTVADSELRTKQATLEACIKHSDTLNGLFKDSTRRYKDMGDKAAGHAADVQMMLDRWPE
mgnify:CR=1 FL=1